MNTFFGLLTDFGFDFAVASIKGVLLKALPNARVIDVDHSIEKFNILNAAFVIEKVYRFLPEGTIFLCVVDPGVGTDRDIVCVEYGSYRFVGPNNGVFHFILNKPGATIHKIEQNLFTSESVTFHGRDIFAPAAISLARGDRSILVSLEDEDIVRLHNLGNQTTEGVITYIDSFGNIKTNLIIPDNFILNDYVQLLINGKPYTVKFTRTFLGVESGELLCYKGSNGTLEIAVNLGSAKQYLDAHVGNSIVCCK